MLLVSDTSDKSDLDIADSNAILGIGMPKIGQLSQLNVPFRTYEES